MVEVCNFVMFAPIFLEKIHDYRSQLTNLLEDGVAV